MNFVAVLLLLRHVLCIRINGRPEAQVEYTGAWPDWRTGEVAEAKKPLVVVPGFGGDKRRYEIVAKNLKSLRESFSDFDCIIYQWRKIEIDHERLRPCQIIDVYAQKRRSMEKDQSNFTATVNMVYDKAELEAEELAVKRLWTFWMKIVREKAIAEHSHVMLMLDDVDITNVDIDKMLRVMAFNNVTIGAPSITGSEIPSMAPETKQAVGRRVTYIEMQLTVFTPEMYKCWQTLIDLQMNPYGWGMDQFLQSVCQPKQALIDNCGAAHHRNKEAGYDRKAAGKAMQAYSRFWIAKGYERVADPKTHPKLVVKEILRSPA